MPLNFEHSADYTYIDEALRAHWAIFTSLESEMSAFVPRAVDDFTAEREAMIDRLRILNPDSASGELTTFVDQQIGYLALPDWQLEEKFDSRHMTEYVTVTMLSHALCEALINAVLAIGLVTADSEDLFTLLEKADLKQKWILGPRIFAPEYRFPEGTALHETLTMLARQRNALMHHKIELNVAGARILKGSDFERKDYPDEQRWLRRYFSLPYDLAALVRQMIPRVGMTLLYERAPIEVAAAHRQTPIA